MCVFVCTVFCTHDLHLDPMTLIYEIDLDLCTINQVRLSKVSTDRQTQPSALPPTFAGGKKTKQECDVNE